MDEFKQYSGWTAEYNYFRTQDAIDLLSPKTPSETTTSEESSSIYTLNSEEQSSHSKTYTEDNS